MKPTREIGLWVEIGKNRIFLGFAFVALLATLAVRSEPWALKQVQLKVDDKTVPVTTLKRTVGEVLAQAGIELNFGDDIDPGPGSRVAQGSIISVKRAFPVFIEADGKRTDWFATGGSVKEVLDAAGVNLAPRDKVLPGLAAPVLSGMTLQVVRVREEVVSKLEKVPFSVEKRPDARLEKGKTRVLRPGQEGTISKVYRLLYEDARLVKRELLSKRSLKEPVSQVIAFGTQTGVRTLLTARGPVGYSRVLDMEATAYYPGPLSDANEVTATGTRARFGVVAVDPKVIPLGSKVWVPGYGLGSAEDVGGAIKGNRIDLCFNTYKEAIRYGRQKVKVYIIKE
ncbi:MAG: DUF348 domain-containing protein [Firmicutes bacterium]|nr:DUF348 domain-containing protein [Bacillota bacterium]